jgi:hypothetical protein
VARFATSASQPVGSPGGANIAASAATLSCETMTDGIPRAAAQRPVQRRVVRSDTSRRPGRSSSSRRRSGRRATMARYPPVPGTGTPQPSR